MITEPKISDREAQHYVGIRTWIAMGKMGSGIIPQLLDEIMAWLGKQGVAPVGAPFMRYHVINMQTKMDVELGWPVAEPVPGNERISASTLPAGKYASLVYTGVKNGIKGNGALLDWGAEKGLIWDTYKSEHGDGFGARIEFYLTEPDEEPNPAKWETEVAIRLADEQ